jgi:hypothetical protein
MVPLSMQQVKEPFLVMVLFFKSLADAEKMVTIYGY